MNSRDFTTEWTDQGGEVDEQLRETFDEPVDELDRELQQMARAIAEGREDELPELPANRFHSGIVDEGRPMAIFSYFSVVFGLPVFVVPFVLRGNEFALHHARAAGVIYLLSLIFLVLALTNCAIFLPLVFVCYIPALIGMYRAAAGVQAGTSALGPTGNKVFGFIELED